MRRIRVAISNLPVLLKDILQQVLSNCGDLEVIVCEGSLGFEAAIEADPDVIDVGAAAEQSQQVARDLVLAAPSSRVIVIESNGISARTFDEDHTEGDLLSPTVEGIIEAIRKPPSEP